MIVIRRCMYLPVHVTCAVILFFVAFVNREHARGPYLSETTRQNTKRQATIANLISSRDFI
jgi:hypothetical protein